MNFISISFFKLKLKNIFLRHKITPLEIMIFFRQLSTLITSGIPIIQSIETLYQTQKNITLKSILLDLKFTIEKGNHLSSSLRKFPNYFDHITCYLLAMSECAGTFELTLQHLANHKEKTYHFHHKIKRSLFYPSIIILIAIFVCSIMLLVIIPKFSQLFQEMHTPLPTFTLIVIQISELLRHYGFILLFPSISLILYIRFTSSYGKFSQPLQKAILICPIIGTLINYKLLICFTQYLSMTLKAGLPLNECIPLIAKASGNNSFENALALVKQNIEKGNKIHSAMKNNSHFPHLLVEMIKIGEESGKLDDMLEKISLLYENELNQLTAYLSDLLEPLIMVILGVLIGGLVIAMYLPIFKLGTIL